MTRPGRILLLLLFLLAGGLAGGAATAQITDAQREYVAQWQDTAKRAEEVIDAARASNAALEQLRKDLVSYRETFRKTRDANRSRLQSLRAQLEVLGPPPEDGREEPADLAALRASLQRQYDELRVPSVVADEAFTRANGLIAEIDRIVRERQTRKILHRGPSPLDPSGWSEAMRDLSIAAQALTGETQAQLARPSAREQLRNNALIIAALLGAGVVLLFRARAWSRRIGDYLRRFGTRNTGLWSILASVLVLLLQIAGIVAIAMAVRMSGTLGFRGSLILQAVPAWVTIFLFYRWLADQLLALRTSANLADIPESRLRQARRYIALLGALVVLRGAVNLFEQLQNISEASRSVIGFPGIVATAFVLIRLQVIGRAIQGRDGAEGAQPAQRPAFGGVVMMVRRVILVLGAVAPLLAIAGYVHAAEAVIYPVVLSLTLISVGIILHRVLTDLYGLVSGRGSEEARGTLFSVLAGFVVTVLLMPLLALTWGARVADLTEMWSRFLNGFQIGDMRISPTGFLIFAIVFGIGYALTRLAQSSLRNSLLPRTDIDPGAQNAIVAGTGYVGIFLAALAAITWAGFDLSSIAIVAGALSVGIGFGLQTIVSNFVSGIILLIERPIAKGDWIEVEGTMGYVRDISVRATRVETFDRTDVIIPNSSLVTGTVTNYTRGNTVGRVIVPVGVAYGSDTRKVEKILLEIANAHPMVLANPAPSVVFQGFGADSLDFEIRAILRDVNWVLSVRSDMNFEIERRFREEGIEIPFAQRDIWLRNPEELARAVSGAPPAGPSGHEATPERPPKAREGPKRPDTGDMEGGDDL